MFPNVPNVPGVPPVLRRPGFTPVTVALLIADAARFFGGLLGPRWGIFQDGVAVIEAESVVGVQYRQSWALANYPLEQGGFESYDKVSLPFDLRVRFASGGTEQQRAALLRSVEEIAGNTELYDVITPEKTYSDVNVVHYDYRREAIKGAGLIQIDIWCQEVRENAVSLFSDAKTPSGAGVANGGTVQTSSYDEVGFAAGSWT